MTASAETEARGEQNRRRWRARKTGRPRHPGEREAETGDLKRKPAGERRDDIMRTVMEQPHRRGIPVSKLGTDGPRGPGDPRAAYVFGRMRLQGDAVLTKVQHDALAHWLETFVRYTRAIGLPQVHYGNCLAQNVGGGQHGEEPDPASATASAVKATRAFRELEATISEHLGVQTTDANAALVHVCLMDREPLREMAGTLRMAANAIDRHMSSGGKRKASSSISLAFISDFAPAN